jgi:hypothetical protein
MFRAVHRQIARFLNWVNGTGPGASPSRNRISREVADHRRDLEGSAGKWGDVGGGPGGL